MALSLWRPLLYRENGRGPCTKTPPAGFRGNPHPPPCSPPTLPLGHHNTLLIDFTHQNHGWWWCASTLFPTAKHTVNPTANPTAKPTSNPSASPTMKLGHHNTLLIESTHQNHGERCVCGGGSSELVTSLWMWASWCVMGWSACTGVMGWSACTGTPRSPPPRTSSSTPSSPQASLTQPSRPVRPGSAPAGYDSVRMLTHSDARPCHPRSRRPSHRPPRTPPCP